MTAMAISTPMLNKMKHAIGYEPNRVRRGKYLYYRNYYGAAPRDIGEWEFLVSKGFAFRDGDSKIFSLTERGLDYLEDVLRITIENRDVTEYDVLDVLISNELDASNFESIVNVVFVAEALRISRHKAKKLIGSLRKEGLVELHCVSFCDAHDDHVSPPYWGYMITEKVKETEQYKTRAEEHNKFCDIREENLNA
ncbi:MAG: hypothetical protein ACOX4Q_09010 [Syntrophomonadales bacterium]|jgi:hypothetical protein